MMAVLDETGEAVACFQTSGPAPICMKLDVANPSPAWVDEIPITKRYASELHTIRIEGKAHAWLLGRWTTNAPEVCECKLFSMLLFCVLSCCCPNCVKFHHDFDFE